MKFIVTIKKKRKKKSQVNPLDSIVDQDGKLYVKIKDKTYQYVGRVVEEKDIPHA